MITRRILQAAAVVGALATTASAGRWIAPDWPEGKEPRFEPVPLYWFVVRDYPLVYRTEVEVPQGADRATALLRTSGWAYVWVDGCQVYAWAPRPREKDRPEVPADPARVHELDLTPQLTPGRHVLAVSAPAAGFVLDGGLYAGAKRLAPLATGRGWAVAKFPPTTITEDDAVMRLGFSGALAPVKEVADKGAPDAPPEPTEWAASEDALARAFHAAFVQRAERDLADALWRLELLTRRGIYIVGDAAYGWGGPLRLDPAVLKRAATALGAAQALLTPLKELRESKAETVADLEKALPRLRAARRALDQVLAEAEGASRQASDADEHKALKLAAAAVGASLSLTETLTEPAKLRDKVAAQIGHPLNRLNESRYDRLGWINHPGLADSDIHRWGIRISPSPSLGPGPFVAPSTSLGPGPAKAAPSPSFRAAPAGEWRQFLFATDPTGDGVRELRWSIGYNVETQWTRINPTESWTRDKRFADYRGIAWYRTRIYVPAEWAGSDVVLALHVAGRERVWLNDKEVTALATKAPEGSKTSEASARTYKVPSDHVAFGAENFLAVRVEASGAERGLVGPVELRCPALESSAAQKAPPADVLATPLSPCVVITPWTDTLHIYHPGRAELLLPGQVKPAPCDYRSDKDGRLKANWALLWLPPASAASPLRPILLVFRRQPLAIRGDQGLTVLKLNRPGERVIAVRPWVKARFDDDSVPLALDEAASFWSRAALAVPLDYMSVTRLLAPGAPYDKTSIASVPAGPVLGHTIVYDYLETRDEWGTAPLRLAPLPALCSFALDRHFPSLKVQGKVRVVQDGGPLAPYRAVPDADRVSYSYSIEPYPRFAGFTSWMFAGGDAGVVGNKRELELLAAIGANSFRPQHNWSDERPPRDMDPGGDRSRVQITADYANAVGINYMNNIDQTLGRAREFVRERYDEFMALVGAHYEKIAKQLAARPFWAVAYDLINEPFDHRHERYNPAMKELTRRVRAIDPTHLLYIEPCEAWGAIQQLKLIEPTGDPLTLYSFHDYNFRLNKPEDRWPTLERDITAILKMWLPAIEFQIRHAVPMHCGEFGGFAPATHDSAAQALLLNDFFRIFDQFGMHHHYYSGREVYQRLADGSLRPSGVVRAYRAYFRRPDFNAYYKKSPGHPSP